MSSSGNLREFQALIVRQKCAVFTCGTLQDIRGWRALVSHRECVSSAAILLRGDTVVEILPLWTFVKFAFMLCGRRSLSIIFGIVNVPALCTSYSYASHEMDLLLSAGAQSRNRALLSDACQIFTVNTHCRKSPLLICPHSLFFCVRVCMYNGKRSNNW